MELGDIGLGLSFESEVTSVAVPVLSLMAHPENMVFHLQYLGHPVLDGWLQGT